jgi:hypothetical protein
MNDGHLTEQLAVHYCRPESKKARLWLEPARLLPGTRQARRRSIHRHAIVKPPIGAWVTNDTYEM